jgi:hypothetical protein
MKAKRENKNLIKNELSASEEKAGENRVQLKSKDESAMKVVDEAKIAPQHEKN